MATNITVLNINTVPGAGRRPRNSVLGPGGLLHGAFGPLGSGFGAQRPPFFWVAVKDLVDHNGGIVSTMGLLNYGNLIEVIMAT